jgi:hypothetical protein
VPEIPHFTQTEALNLFPRFPAAAGKVTLQPLFPLSWTAFPNFPLPKLAGLERVPLCEPLEGEAVVPLDSSNLHQFASPLETLGYWTVDPLISNIEESLEE